MAADFPPTDEHIIALFQQRSEDAIEATYQKYGGLLFQLAWNILENYEDAEECVNDTCLVAWNDAADVRPGSLKSWLCRIVRNEASIACVTGHRRSAETEASTFCLMNLPSVFRPTKIRQESWSCGSWHLRSVPIFEGKPQDRRTVFIQRYYFASTASDIAVEQGMTPEAVRQLLYRMRQELKEHLQSEGYRDDELEF